MADKQLHTWQFFKAGGVTQVLLETGDDILNLEHLDPKLWVALACPTHGMDLDARTLYHLDTDKDGRIRVNEVIEAARWVGQNYNDPGQLFRGGDSVQLSNIKDQAILAAAKRMLASCGKADAQAISLGDLSIAREAFAQMPFNGDGVIRPDCTDLEDVRKAIADIIATLGGVPDRNGVLGVDKERVEAFFAQAKAVCDWYAKADKSILPLGPEKTALAAQAVDQVKEKIDDYFARCRLAGYDPKAAALLNPKDSDYLAVAPDELSRSWQRIAGLPLSRIEPARPLPLLAGLNPAWEAAMARFASVAVVPLLGSQEAALTEQDWQELKSRLGPYYAWQADRPKTKVEGLGIQRLRALLSGDLQARIMDLIDRDMALAPEAAQFSNLERLVLFQRDLVRFLRNFVNFADFYGGAGAVFQSGVLYMDSRACLLCMDVEDAAKHGNLAVLSGAFLAYCDCTRPDGKKKTIVAAFTAGDCDNLMVGRNGLFYDSSGLEWDATIIRIVSNPISIRQAFWSPYKKLIRWIDQMVAKRAEAAEAKATQKLTTGTEQLAAQASPEATKAPTPRKVDIGTVAALGVGLGFITTALGTLLGVFIGLGPMLPLGIIGAIVCLVVFISGPSMALAYLKLRRRNLGPLLDASGWAINGWARINVPLGKVLTKTAKLPEGARVHLTDPLADKRFPWWSVIVLVAVAVVVIGLVVAKWT